VDDATGWQPVTTAGFDAARSGDDRYAIYVWRSERHGGDTETEKSRRTLALPQRCVAALRQHRAVHARDRLRAGELWQDHSLVFASTVGTPLSANNVIRALQIITKKAGFGEEWVPREMRHTFVSVLSANGVPVESIALLAGHDRTATTELVYRHEIRPALTQGAEVMDKIFG
jgi:site-specific recombinase XerD